MKKTYVLAKYWGGGAAKVKKKLGPSPIKVAASGFVKLRKKIWDASGREVVFVAKIGRNPKCPKCGGTDFDITTTNGRLDDVFCGGCGGCITNGKKIEPEDVHVSQAVWESIVWQDEWDKMED